MIIDGQIQDKPVLDVSVATDIERGLLGIALAKQPDGKTMFFFLILNQATIRW